MSGSEISGGGVFDLVVADWPAPANVRAFSTTRKGGISREQWGSLNLGGNCGDDPSSVQKNRILLRSLLPCAPTWLQQVHGTAVLDLDSNSDGDADLSADAAITATVGQVCAVLTADCLPVLFCNKAGTRVAAAHAGWRGLVGGVLESTVAAFDRKAGDIIAWMGPAIGPGAFEVGRDVYEAYCGTGEGAYAENKVAFNPHGDRWLADLYTLARLALARVGVVDVYGGEHCTYSNAERFFSYRRDGETGRMATLIWIEPA